MEFVEGVTKDTTKVGVLLLIIENYKSIFVCSRILKGKPLLKNLILHQPEVMTDLSIWNNKETRRDNLFLLSTVKLQGNYANYVSVSPTFSAFVTVDNNGKIYIIEVFDNVH